MVSTNLRAAAPTAIDLFCGVGGLSLGLSQTGFKLTGAADSDQGVLDMHAVNFPDVPVACLDLFSATAKSIRQVLKLGKTQIDLLAGGPPCQGFSSGGVQHPRDNRNKGVPAFARLVTELRPRYFLMENVRGLMFAKHKPKRKQFERTLRDSGYIVMPFKLLDASDFGVPQRRVRSFVMGCLEGQRVPNYPVAEIGPKVTVADAIRDLSEIDRHLVIHEEDAFTGVLASPSEYASRMRQAGGTVKILTGCLKSVHTETVVKRFKDTPPGGQEPISRFYRLKWDGVSPTIRAGTGPERGSHTAPRPIHPEWPRCITVREAARLHSFPDWFQFRGTRWHGFRQIGNSVPPLLAKAVGQAIYEACVKGGSNL
ncbi:DNA cytosine methyltransferase [Zavarzinella formosa]|uniref:DNA cytosine methyltransferase n=1 Tax=Zavarzinella formosa TaxID=360055 RepID=UPI00036CBEB6|nr:DNA cytosine methyltransferase [Zavarzinella formosa]